MGFTAAKSWGFRAVLGPFCDHYHSKIAKKLGFSVLQLHRCYFSPKSIVV